MTKLIFTILIIAGLTYSQTFEWARVTPINLTTNPTYLSNQIVSDTSANLIGTRLLVNKGILSQSYIGDYVIEKLEEFKATSFNFPLINLVWSGMLVLLSVALLNRRFGKSLIPVSVQNQDHAINGKAVFLIFAQNVHQPGEKDGSADGPVEIPHSSQDHHHDDQNREPEAKGFRTGGGHDTGKEAPGPSSKG